MGIPEVCGSVCGSVKRDLLDMGIPVKGGKRSLLRKSGRGDEEVLEQRLHRLVKRSVPAHYPV